MNEGAHLDIYRRLREEDRNEAYFHGPVGYAQTLKLRFCVGDLDLPERRKRYTSNRVEEEEGAQKCSCGKAEESRTVGEYKRYKEEWGRVRDGHEENRRM